MVLFTILGCSEPQPGPKPRPVARLRARQPDSGPRPRTLLAIIEAVFARRRVPEQNRPVYLALAQLESNFTVDQVSPVGALGLFQITPVTARSILEEHPDFDPQRAPIFNPVVRGKRRVLFRGADRRHSLKVMRWYAARLRRARDAIQHQESGTGYHERLRALDVRFDPAANARLAVFHLEQLRKGYFGHRRCYRYRGTNAAHKGKKLCGSFAGRHATLFAAAGYHLGVGAVESMLAASQARSIRRYVKSLQHARQAMYRRNYYYIAKLQRLSRIYAALLKEGPLTRERLARAFPRQPALARRLFQRYAATFDR